MNKEPINVTVPLDELVSILGNACNWCDWHRDDDDQDIVEDIETCGIPAIKTIVTCVEEQITIPAQYDYVFKHIPY